MISLTSSATWPRFTEHLPLRWRSGKNRKSLPPRRSCRAATEREAPNGAHSGDARRSPPLPPADHIEWSAESGSGSDSVEHSMCSTGESCRAATEGEAPNCADSGDTGRPPPLPLRGISPSGGEFGNRIGNRSPCGGAVAQRLRGRSAEGAAAHPCPVRSPAPPSRPSYLRNVPSQALSGGVGRAWSANRSCGRAGTRRRRRSGRGSDRSLGTSPGSLLMRTGLVSPCSRSAPSLCRQPGGLRFGFVGSIRHRRVCSGTLARIPPRSRPRSASSCM